MSKDLNLLFPYVKYLCEQFLAKCKAEGLIPTITSTLRTMQEQTDIYAIGRTKPGNILSYTKAGYSMHNYGLAFDCSFPHDSDYAKAAVIGKSLGLTWGGDFKVHGKPFIDRPHFQWTGGLTTADLVSGKRPVNPLEPVQTPQETVVSYAKDKILTDEKKWLKKAMADPEIYALLDKFKKYDEGRK